VTSLLWKQRADGINKKDETQWIAETGRTKMGKATAEERIMVGDTTARGRTKRRSSVQTRSRQLHSKTWVGLRRGGAGTNTHGKEI